MLDDLFSKYVLEARKADHLFKATRRRSSRLGRGRPSVAEHRDHPVERDRLAAEPERDRARAPADAGAGLATRRRAGSGGRCRRARSPARPPNGSRTPSARLSLGIRPGVASIGASRLGQWLARLGPGPCGGSSSPCRGCGTARSGRCTRSPCEADDHLASAHFSAS